MSSERDPSAVRFEGDLSPKQRSSILKFADIILRGKGLFAKSTGSRLEITEVSLYEREEDKKTQVRMVFELDVDQGTCFASDRGSSLLKLNFVWYFGKTC
ncbi:hypothetical protein TRAPUB_8520 [Trametes pubescens]|uniref:Uncharacterized protein n=1 Tax=Trametes pubescens TaxID=154538 RepID=A0A1M2W5C0_TRAPU|nr:hypothetical protein TRAPUB_8520 [Trametes pubescens]